MKTRLTTIIILLSTFALEAALPPNATDFEKYQMLASLHAAVTQLRVELNDAIDRAHGHRPVGKGPGGTSIDIEDQYAKAAKRYRDFVNELDQDARNRTGVSNAQEIVTRRLEDLRKQLSELEAKGVKSQAVTLAQEEVQKAEKLQRSLQGGNARPQPPKTTTPVPGSSGKFQY